MEKAGQVQLVFRGEVLDGFRVDDVKRALGPRLQLDDAAVARLLAADHTVIKRGIDRADAQRYVATFASLGARLHVEALAPAPVPAPIAAPLVPPAEEIVCPNCGERQSKRILCRSCSTDMPMGIAAKLEAEAQARAARLAASRAARGLAPDGRSQGAMADAPPMWGFGFSGRMGRLVGASAGALILLAMYLLTAYVAHQPDSRWIAGAVGMLVLMVLSIRHSVLRFHDLNITGWATVVLFVPVLNAVAGLVLLLMPGTNGDNHHGERPREGDWYLLLGAIGALALAMYHTLPGMMTDLAQARGNTSEQVEAGGGGQVTAVVRTLPAGAQADLHGAYATQPGFKAFAVSTGAWGWAYGAPSMEQAIVRALMQCESRRTPDMPECDVIDQREP